MASRAYHQHISLPAARTIVRTLQLEYITDEALGVVNTFLDDVLSLLVAIVVKRGQPLVIQTIRAAVHALLPSGNIAADCIATADHIQQRTGVERGWPHRNEAVVANVVHDRVRTLLLRLQQYDVEDELSADSLTGSTARYIATIIEYIGRLLLTLCVEYAREMSRDTVQEEDTIRALHYDPNIKGLLDQIQQQDQPNSPLPGSSIDIVSEGSSALPITSVSSSLASSMPSASSSVTSLSSPGMRTRSISSQLNSPQPPPRSPSRDVPIPRTATPTLPNAAASSPINITRLNTPPLSSAGHSPARSSDHRSHRSTDATHQHTPESITSRKFSADAAVHDASRHLTIHSSINQHAASTMSPSSTMHSQTHQGNASGGSALGKLFKQFRGKQHEDEKMVRSPNPLSDNWTSGDGDGAQATMPRSSFEHTSRHAHSMSVSSATSDGTRRPKYVPLSTIMSQQMPDVGDSATQKATPPNNHLDSTGAQTIRRQTQNTTLRLSKSQGDLRRKHQADSISPDASPSKAMLSSRNKMQEFEDLIQSGETKKMSLTPERMRTIEATDNRKPQPRDAARGLKKLFNNDQSNSKNRQLSLGGLRRRHAPKSQPTSPINPASGQSLTSMPEADEASVVSSKRHSRTLSTSAVHEKPNFQPSSFPPPAPPSDRETTTSLSHMRTKSYGGSATSLVESDSEKRSGHQSSSRSISSQAPSVVSLVTTGSSNAAQDPTPQERNHPLENYSSSSSTSLGKASTSHRASLPYSINHTLKDDTTEKTASNHSSRSHLPLATAQSQSVQDDRPSESTDLSRIFSSAKRLSMRMSRSFTEHDRHSSARPSEGRTSRSSTIASLLAQNTSTTHRQPSSSTEQSASEQRSRISYAPHSSGKHLADANTEQIQHTSAEDVDADMSGQEKSDVPTRPHNPIVRDSQMSHSAHASMSDVRASAAYSTSTSADASTDAIAVATVVSIPAVTQRTSINGIALTHALSSYAASNAASFQARSALIEPDTSSSFLVTEEDPLCSSFAMHDNGGTDDILDDESILTASSQVCPPPTVASPFTPTTVTSAMDAEETDHSAVHTDAGKNHSTARQSTRHPLLATTTSPSSTPDSLASSELMNESSRTRASTQDSQKCEQSDDSGNDEEADLEHPASTRVVTATRDRHPLRRAYSYGSLSRTKLMPRREFMRVNTAIWKLPTPLSPKPSATFSPFASFPSTATRKHRHSRKSTASNIETSERYHDADTQTTDEQEDAQAIILSLKAQIKELTEQLEKERAMRQELEELVTCMERLHHAEMFGSTTTTNQPESAAVLPKMTNN